MSEQGSMLGKHANAQAAAGSGGAAGTPLHQESWAAPASRLPCAIVCKVVEQVLRLAQARLPEGAAAARPSK